MDESVVMLILTVALATLSVVGLVLFWLRDERIRAIQMLLGGLGVVGLFLSGLMAVIWDGIKEMWRWSAESLGVASVQVGLVFIALAVVGFVVTGVVARRQPAQHPQAKNAGRKAKRQQKKEQKKQAQKARPQDPKLSGGDKPASPSPDTGADSDMDEIEAILKNRGID